MAWEFLGKVTWALSFQCSYRLSKKLWKGMLELFLKCAHSFLRAFWELIFDK